MKILILSSTCSQKKYKEICDKRTVKSLDTNQKFFLSIISGLKNNGCNDITCISTIPVSFRTYPERWIKQTKEESQGVSFVYCKTINYPIIRNLYASLQIKKLVKRYLYNVRGEEVIIVTDGLFYEFSKACRYIHRKGKKVFTIVTDIPDFVINIKKKKSVKGWLSQKYGELATNSLRNNYDGYIFLTKQMNEICNYNSKPFIVVEGLLSEHKRIEKKMDVKNDLPTVLYAGKYNREFGSILLANSAKYLKGICNIVMYGAGGDCLEELKRIADENDNLIINGIISLEKLLEIETNADLLVNPRPAGQIFTKYSFPSKTLEYLDSGTPVLMYRLEGIPEEYDMFLNYIEGETSEAVASSIRKILSKGKMGLYEEGKRGKHFVRDKKNCTQQSRKMLDFMRKYGNEESSNN